ncbi:MAG: acyl-CoA thioesterase [Cohaesibacter sp.]|jgi:acyl-CoA thioester hydrolase|nr:acyl-CoA thioesterase [Cohaesibacter sp.]
MARPVPFQRSHFSVFQPLQTRWADNDIYGHMNNVVHYALFDTAVNEWLIEAGLLDIHHGSQVGLVVETGCHYFAELAFPDKIEAGIGIERIGSSSVVYRVALFRKGEDVAAAQGRFVHVYVDRNSRKPLPLPQKWQDALSALLLTDPD